MVTNVLAADVGGTNIRIGVVDRDGVITSRGELSTPSTESPDAIAAAISDLALHVSNKSGKSGQNIERFGLAIAALVDLSSGRISRSPNLPQLNQIDLGSIVAKRTGLEIVMDNDANAAAVGEHWLGAARGFKNAICITMGTGVGGGLILNGVPYVGSDGTAGEIGHVCVEPEGQQCGCGSRGCLEQYASATAIVRMARERTGGSDNSESGSAERLTSSDVFDAAMAGNELARSVFQTVGRYLGIACADLVNILNPDVIVIAGGVSAGWQMFIGPTIDEMKKRAFQQPAERVKIVRGELGDDAGILGAAKRAFEQANKGISLT